MINLMRNAFQELLLFIPLYQLNFLTPPPKKLVYYDEVIEEIPDRWLEKPTLLMIGNDYLFDKFNEKEVVNQLIQDPNFVGVVIYLENKCSICKDIPSLFYECQIPVIQVNDPSFVSIFQQDNNEYYTYGQMSKELAGTMEHGFIKLASELSKGLETPFLYLDESNQLLWHFGKEDELRQANRWLNCHRKDLENGAYTNLNTICKNKGILNKNNSEFELYSINIGGYMNHTIIASSQLVNWQKRMVDKLVGLIALLLQTEKMFQGQQEMLKEHFVYDLLYHKFESHQVMVKQGKSWGWNLEKPHHLLVIHVHACNEVMENINWLNEILLFIEMKQLKTEGKRIVFPFQDQIVVFLEDGENRTISERKKYVMDVANELEKELSNSCTKCQFFIGIGKWYEDTTYLNKSYQEAKLALRFGRIWFENKRIYHINDLGVLRLLIQIHHEILLDFCQEYLQPLIDSDRENGTEYIQTLQKYIQSQGIVNEVSEQLYIHPNTLRNRIKKIEDMTGIDLQNPEEFMNIIIAIKILSFINK